MHRPTPWMGNRMLPAMFQALDVAKAVLQAIESSPRWRRPFTWPSEALLSSLLESVFGAGLEKHEGLQLRPRVFLDPGIGEDGQLPTRIYLSDRVPANLDNIVRLCPAHGRWGGLLVKSGTEGPEILGYYTGGRSEESPMHAGLCIESLQPGRLRISHWGGVIATFKRGEIVTFNDRFDAGSVAAMLAKTFGGESDRVANAAFLFLTVARAMEGLGHGGALWLLPAQQQGQPEELLKFGKRVSLNEEWLQPFDEEWRGETLALEALNGKEMREAPPLMARLAQVAGAFDRQRKQSVCMAIADLALVDGAVLADVSPNVLGFNVIHNGLKTPPGAVMIHDSVPDLFVAGVPVSIDRFGGSRHRSAAAFCTAMAHAAALVVSADGGIRAFMSRSKGEVWGCSVMDVARMVRPNSFSLSRQQ